VIRFSLLLPLLALSAVWAQPAAAQRTDVVELRNGDEITGEIKELARGKLKFKTDDMGTIYVEWEKIVRLVSTSYFQFELDSGNRVYGQIPPPGDSGRLIVVLTDTIRVPVHRVVGIVPIKQTFWSRIDGSVELGFSFAKANENLQLTFFGEAQYRGRKWGSSISYDAYRQKQETTDEVSRNTARLTGERFFRSRWDGLVFLQFETNTQLSIDLRTTVAVTGLYDLIRNNSSRLYLVGGLGFLDEAFTGSTSNNQALQLITAASYEYFRFHDPEVDIATQFSVSPVITDLGRFLITGNFKGKYEILTDLYIALTFFAAYDTDPPDVNASKEDYGTALSLGWKY
jgi:hypothetical protein